VGLNGELEKAPDRNGYCIRIKLAEGQLI